MEKEKKPLISYLVDITEQDGHSVDTFVCEMPSMRAISKHVRYNTVYWDASRYKINAVAINLKK